MKLLIVCAFAVCSFGQNLPTSGQFTGVSGNGRSVVTTTGTQTSGDCVKIDANGNHVANGSACGGVGAGTVTIVSAPSTIFSVSNPTTTPALAYATGQTANLIFGSNSSGNVGLMNLTTAQLPSIASTFLSDSSALVRTTDTGSVTNTMLAGSIANNKLANSSLTVAGHSVSLGGTQAIACADLSNASASCATDATNATNITSGTLPNARIVALPNANLANSSVTVAGHLISLGGSQTIACADLSNASASCATDATNASNIGSGTLAVARGGTGTGSTLTGVIRGNSSAYTASELSGDATTSGSNAVTIATGAVTDAKASLLIKPSVGLIATANLTLSGAQTIDGVLGTAGTTLVLATGQSTGSQNGPWVMQSGAWTRPTWYPNGGTTQALQFSTTFARLGSTYEGSMWRMTTAGAITIDTDSTTWVVAPTALNSSTISGTIPVANGGTGTGSTLTGLVRGNSSAMTAAELSGDASTSGSNAVTVKQIHDNVTAITNASSPYSVVSTDSYISCDATSGAVVINLPAATGTGRELTVKKIDSTSNACTPTRASSDLIDGSASYSLTSQYAASKVVDASSAVWHRAHVNQLVGDVTGTSTSNTVSKVNGNTPGGTCTNQAVTSLSSSAVPTCTTLTSAYVNNSIALTGTDINTSNQVTASHLSAALPVNQGGTGTASTLTGLMRGNSSAMTAAELSGDCTTSSSNAVTCTQVNGSNFTVNSSGTVTKASGITTAGLGHPVEVYNTATGVVSTAQGPTTMATPGTGGAPSPGRYRISGYIVQTAIGSGGTCNTVGQVAVDFTYKDGDTGNSVTIGSSSVTVALRNAGNAATNTLTMSNSNTTSTSLQATIQPFTINAQSGAGITYQTFMVATDNCTTHETYNFYPVLEAF